MIILLLFAVLAGLVTVLSPCILPILPLLLAAGAGQGHTRSLGIIVGVMASFSFFTLTLTALVRATGLSADLLRYAAIMLIIFFALTMIFPMLGDYFAAKTAGIGQLGTWLQNVSNAVSSEFARGVILGCALGLLWTPCAGPILAAIITLVATSSVTLVAALVTLAYSFGAAVPMFLIVYGGSKITNSTYVLAGYSEIIRKIFGLLMLVSAFAILFHVDVWLQQVTLKYFPMINVENNELVRAELSKLRVDSNKNFSFDSDTGPAAPALVGLSSWINSPALTIEQLRGKVVLIDFWTYSCINCVRTLPYLKKWYDAYKDNGLVIVGVHTPEFEFEKNKENVQAAVKRFGIMYPVALDNDYKTWQNYNNHYWPAHYLIDQNGIVKKHHFGEGAYQEIENALRALLGLAPVTGAEQIEPTSMMPLTPETYLGFERGHSYSPEIVLMQNQAAEYDYHKSLGADYVGLKGSWIAGPQSLQAAQDGALLDLNFSARHLYLVMRAPAPALVDVLLDGKPVPAQYWTADMNDKGQLMVNEARMYHLLDLKNDYGRHLLTLQFPKGVSPYVFTFGAGEK